jgi:hypothetical protein
MSSLLAVIGIDDLVIAGVAAVSIAFAARQRRIKANFLRRHGEAIREENERIAAVWRAKRPREKELVVDRRFKPPVSLAPTVKVSEKFRRDPSPRYEGWFS